VAVDDPAGFTDLHREGVRGDERVGAGAHWPGPELGHLLEVLAISDTLRLRESRDPEVRTRAFIRRVSTPRRE
jgi:hypothetical protein